MTGSRVRFWRLTSDASLALPFPNAGQNFGRLTIRKRTKQSPEVMFRVDKGQIVCDTPDTCTLRLKFGEKPPITMAATRSTSGQSSLLFIDDARRFIREAKTASKILAQPTIYGVGPVVVSFSNDRALTYSDE